MVLREGVCAFAGGEKRELVNEMCKLCTNLLSSQHLPPLPLTTLTTIL
jgi:hypothetical protein